MVEKIEKSELVEIKQIKHKKYYIEKGKVSEVYKKYNGGKK